MGGGPGHRIKIAAARVGRLAQKNPCSAATQLFPVAFRTQIVAGPCSFVQKS